MVVLALATIVVWQMRAPKHQPVRKAQTTKAPTPTSHVFSEMAVPSEAAESPQQSIDETNREVAATRRMYAAHAPLRVPEVADPDSAANREILQTMVLKALGRKAADAHEAKPELSQ